MKNKELKKQLIKNGDSVAYNKQRYTYFQNKQFDEIDGSNYFHNDGTQMTSEEIKACFQMKQARKEQRKKIRNHFTWWLSKGYKILFMTFTYDDEKRRKGISINTFKQYVISALSFADDFILNIDYGKENERVHFHALAMVKDYKKFDDCWVDVKRNKGTQTKPKWIKGQKFVCDSLLAYEQKVGFFDAEPCKDDEESAKKLSNYIDKLTLHSIKVKQSYVSVKKGTDYQREKKFNQKVYRQVKRKARHTKLVSNDDLIYILRHNKGILKTEDWCEQEYKLLEEKRRQIAFKEGQIEKLRKSKDIKQVIFDW